MNTMSRIMMKVKLSLLKYQMGHLSLMNIAIMCNRNVVHG